MTGSPVGTGDKANNASSLSICSSARRECLIVLLDLRLHETLLRTIENLVHVNQQHENGTDEAWPSTHLHQKLLHAIRALKSLYVAIINLIDPLGAQLSMSELVLTSAYARSKALGLSTASGPTNSNGPVNTSSKASKSSSSRSNAHSISTMWPSQTPSTATLADIARVADQMFLVGGIIPSFDAIIPRELIIYVPISMERLSVY